MGVLVRAVPRRGRRPRGGLPTTRPTGVQLVGLNTRDSQAAAAAFVDRFEVTYPSVVDTDGSRQLLFHETLPPAAIPSTLVIDRQGRVAGRAIGEVDRSRLLGMIEPILAEEAT